MTQHERQQHATGSAPNSGSGSGAWSKLSYRRFGDTARKTFTFDDTLEVNVHSSGASSTGNTFEVTTGTETGNISAVTATSISESEMITQFPHTRLQSTIIPIGTKLHIFSSGKHYTLTLPQDATSDADSGDSSSGQSSDKLTSPMPATVIEVRVKVGDEVKTGQVVAVLESMKMEISIRAGRDGIVGVVNAEKGMVVEEGGLLVGLKPEA
jgi:3-methylcrotonyl-CoA carboxylase alpha subunit